VTGGGAAIDSNDSYKVCARFVGKIFFGNCVGPREGESSPGGSERAGEAWPCVSWGTLRPSH